MDTLMAKKLIMIPAICSALISDHSESKKRESLTRFLLKYHARPGVIGNSPYIARQFSMYNLGQSEMEMISERLVQKSVR